MFFSKYLIHIVVILILALVAGGFLYQNMDRNMTTIIAICGGFSVLLWLIWDYFSKQVSELNTKIKDLIEAHEKEINRLSKIFEEDKFNQLCDLRPDLCKLARNKSLL